MLETVGHIVFYLKKNYILLFIRKELLNWRYFMYQKEHKSAAIVPPKEKSISTKEASIGIVLLGESWS
jgi:hypothetical protein